MIEAKTAFIPAIIELVKKSSYEENRQHIISYFTSLVSNPKKRKENKSSLEIAHFQQLFKETKDYYYGSFNS